MPPPGSVRYLPRTIEDRTYCTHKKNMSTVSIILFINFLKLSSMRKSASPAVLSRMQLTLHATRRTPHDASRLVQALSAWSMKTRVLCPGIVGMRGSMVIRLRLCMISSTHPRARAFWGFWCVVSVHSCVLIKRKIHTGA